MTRTTILGFGGTSINTGKRTEWSLIQSVIIPVITKSRESDLLIRTSMITDRHRTTRGPLYQLLIKITILEKHKK